MSTARDEHGASDSRVVEERALRRARRAYEVGRVRAGAYLLLYIAPVVAVCAVVAESSFSVVAVGAAVAVLAVAFLWRGQALEQCLAPGFVGGALGFAVPPLFQAWGGACGDDTCSRFCAVAAFAGGALAIFVARRRTAQTGPRAARAASALALFVGLLGALLAGAAGVVGFIIGAIGWTLADELWTSTTRRAC